MQHRFFKFLIVFASAAVLSACEGTFGTKEEAAEGTEMTASTTGTSGTTTGIGAGTGFQGHPLDDPSSLLSRRTVYFDFDRSDIKDADRATIEAHARYLGRNGAAAITLEGHADERGSREYNIALGERRANAVRQLMTLIGAAGQQIRTVSYGEERPVAESHNEDSWQLNRRVEIIYRTR
jgi:peptidoglycan-associated lipoprotein